MRGTARPRASRPVAHFRDSDAEVGSAIAVWRSASLALRVASEQGDEERADRLFDAYHESLQSMSLMRPDSPEALVALAAAVVEEFDNCRTLKALFEDADSLALFAVVRGVLDLLAAPSDEQAQRALGAMRQVFFGDSLPA